jgi:hypothetical protein
MRNRLCSWIVGAVLLSAPALAAGFQDNVTFADNTPLSTNAEIARRMTRPIVAVEIGEVARQWGKSLDSQPLDITKERFAVYVPPTAPPGGYAVLVFVPPWNEAALPHGWATRLDRTGTIFVTAANSGNDANVLSRRVPLALMAAHNIAHSYAINPQKVFVGGFSGGSRVALRLAMGYPDVFHGAFLDAGADPIGNESMPLPSADLFARFRDVRLAFAAGEKDLNALRSNAATERSLRAWCLNPGSDRTLPGGHEIADGTALSRALDTMLGPPPDEPDDAAACRSKQAAELEAKLAEAERLIGAGQRARAQTLLKDVDATYGGLAAPRSLVLLAKTQ